MKHSLKSLNSAFLVFYNHPRFFNIAVIALFFILSLIGILNHSMWRDELNVWTIVRDSSSFSDLLQNIKYEGHPALWYLCLYFLNFFTDNPLIMQFFHLAIATSIITIFLLFSPFSRLQKLLFSFGYFPFYEYATISRNYSLYVLFAFVFCSLFKNRYKNFIALTILLVLMNNANAYGLLISFVLFCALFADLILLKHKLNHLTILSSIGIYGLGLYTSLFLLIPPLDSELNGGLVKWNTFWNLHHFMKVLARIWNSYILILVPGDSKFWDVALYAIISLFILIFFALSFIKKPIPLFIYGLGTIELLFFTYTKVLGSPRHYGSFYIILIIAIWISFYYPSQPDRLQFAKQFFTKAIAWVNRHKSKVLTLILLVQLIAGVVAFSRNLIVPYSASRETANYIKNKALEDMFIVGSQDTVMTPISGYLNRQIYYPESQDMGSFVLYNSHRDDVDRKETLAQTQQLFNEKREEILLILNYELDLFPEELSIEEIAKFTNSYIYNEKYYLYLVSLQE
ncbi:MULTISPECIES: hypothetical protein [Spirulina sp. CCY15215]|uniref:hypothetical protein n=1 Tax=Spirulina sp. CCY15215 TaxID=2767591 RepID=UPI00194F3275|nr:hypothetical protein [Spirulina major]